MTYKEKKAEMMEKYHNAIAAISQAKDVDMGVAFDILKLHAVGIRADFVNQEELKKDYEELVKSEE